LSLRQDGYSTHYLYDVRLIPFSSPLNFDFCSCSLVLPFAYYSNESRKLCFRHRRAMKCSPETPSSSYSGSGPIDTWLQVMASKSTLSLRNAKRAQWRSLVVVRMLVRRKDLGRLLLRKMLHDQQCFGPYSILVYPSIKALT
jgi:hypothetical protein